MEPCDADRSCNLDASIFKGIFVRNLRYLLDVTEDKARVKLYRRFLDTNIASLRHNASCEPQPHKNHTCHIVYLDGAPSYPATGNDLSLESHCPSCPIFYQLVNRVLFVPQVRYLTLCGPVPSMSLGLSSRPRPWISWWLGQRGG